MLPLTAARAARSRRSCDRILAATLLLALAGAASLAAQTASTAAATATTATTPRTFHACYVPYVGTVYRIKEAGLPDQCFGPSSGLFMHIQFSWTDGAGALSSGAAAGGDLTGTYPNPSVSKLLGIALGSAAPTNGQVLGFNGTNWVATTPSSGVTAHSQLTGLLADDHPQYLRTDGTRALTGAMSMGGFRLTGLANATTSGDAVPFQQAVKSGDAAGGDLAGTYPAPTVGKLAGVPLSSTAPASGQVLAFNGTSWAPAAAAAASMPNLPCNQCTATGLHATATGSLTSASGDFAIAMGNSNTAGGTAAVALGGNSTASADGSVAIGVGDVAQGSGAVAIGSGVIANGGIALGSNSISVSDGVALGATAWATGGNGVAIGTRVTANGAGSVAIGTDAEANGFRGAFVFGDNSTLGNTILSAHAPNEFAVRASGGFRFRTATDLSTGCDLPAGSGVFSCTSSRDLKTDFIPVDDDALLSRIAAVPVTTWRYRTEAQPVRHLGPMAQDFRAAFGLGTNETSIGLLDISGVTFAGVQALQKRTDALHAELRALRDQNAGLRAEVTALRDQATAASAARADLERRVAALEAALRQ